MKDNKGRAQEWQSSTREGLGGTGLGVVIYIGCRAWLIVGMAQLDAGVVI